MLPFVVHIKTISKVKKVAMFWSCVDFKIQSSYKRSEDLCPKIRKMNFFEKYWFNPFPPRAAKSSQELLVGKG